MVTTHSVSLDTQGHGDIHDITQQIASAVRESELQAGTVTIFTPSATSALTTIEYESGCIADLQHLLDEIIRLVAE